MIDIRVNDFNRLEMAFTKNCMHSGWSAKYYFPCCPQEIEKNLLETYFDNLKIGTVFAYNDDSPNLIVRGVAKGKNNSSILVMCEREEIWCERLGFLPWNVTEITLENKLFIHSNLGSHFEEYDAEKNFALSKI